MEHTRACPHDCSACCNVRDGSTAEKAILIRCPKCDNLANAYPNGGICCNTFLYQFINKLFYAFSESGNYICTAQYTPIWMSYKSWNKAEYLKM